MLSSAGGIKAVIAVLGALPADLPAPIFLSQHMAPDSRSDLVPLLQHHARLRVQWAVSADRIEPGTVYVVQPAHELTVSARGLVSRRPAPNWSNWFDSTDVLLQSVAETYGAGAIAVTLSGMMAAGQAGLRAVRRQGGLTLAQDRSSAAHFTMPQAAIDFGMADIIFPPERLAEALNFLVRPSAAE